MGNGSFRSQYDDSISGTFSCDTAKVGHARNCSCRIISPTRGQETLVITVLRENNRIVGRNAYIGVNGSLMFSLQFKDERWIGSYMQIDPSDVGSIVIP